MTFLVWAIGTAATGIAVACFFMGVWTEGLVSAAVAVAAMRAAWDEA